MDKDRRLAYLILKDIESESAWSNLSINSHLAEDGAVSPAFIRELVYGVLRNKMLLDYNINRFLSKPNIGKAERILLRMGFYQLVFMDSVPEHAAISETVKLADGFVRGKKGFINAVLRNFQRSGCKLESDSLSTLYSCHESIVKLWLDCYGQEKTEEMLSISNTIPPFTVRVNSLMAADHDLDLSLDGPDFKAGYFSVQDEASQLAVKTLDPKPGSFMIDICAAPGGKTCAAAELMNNTGRIAAFDLYEHRVGLIQKEAKRLGIDIIEASMHDATEPLNEYQNAADYVLCDVPCSGLGVMRRKPEIKYRDITQEVKELTQVQKKILSNAACLVKPGGKLLYSTCTVNPKENGEIIHDFIENNKLFTIESETQLFVTEGGHDGFYICLMGKRID